MAPALEGLGAGEHVMQIFWAETASMQFRWYLSFKSFKRPRDSFLLLHCVSRLTHRDEAMIAAH